MRRKIISIFLLAGLFTFGGCYKNDIEDLQKQVDELNDKVAQNTEAIQNDLLSQINALETELNSLKQETSQEIENLQASLDTIKNDVETNAKSVFYGNLVTDEDYAAYVAAGANVVTGKVVISKVEHVGIVKNLRWVGQELITEFGSVNGIQNVGGDVIVNSTTDTLINLAGLSSIGGNFHVPYNANLKEVNLNDLIVLAGTLSLESGNTSLTTMTFAKLEVVGNIALNDYDQNWGRGGTLKNIILNGANVAGDVTLEYIVNYEDNAGTVISLGEIGGDVEITRCGVETIDIAATQLHGDFIFNDNVVTTLNAKSVSSIAGKMEVNKNFIMSGWGPGAAILGLKTLAFDALTSIGNDVEFNDNRLLGDVLNSVETIDGDVSFNVDYDKLAVIAFEKLTSVENVEVGGEMDSFKGFNMLTSSKTIKFGVPYAIIATVEAFNAITEIRQYNVEVGTIPTYFGGFDLSNSFKSLAYAYRVAVYSQYGGSLSAGSFPALDSVKYLNFNELKGSDADVFEFPALTTIEFNLNIQIDKKGATISLPKVKTISRGMNVYTNYNNAIINLDLPVLDSCSAVNFYTTNNSAPAAVNAKLPALTKVANLNFKFGGGVVDASNLLTALTDLDGKWPRVTLYYQTGQKFCGMSTFLNNLVSNNLLSKVYLYKDGSMVPSANEAAEIAVLTTCP